jgi:hypothetical protein
MFRSASRRRRRWLIGGGVAAVLVVGMAVFVLAYFQPQKLFIDVRVNEPFPVAAPASRPGPSVPPSDPGTLPATGSLAPPVAAATTVAPAPTAVAPEPVAERRGSFVSREHGTTGIATVFRFADGRRVLRIEHLHTSNGPALVVYLSTNRAQGPNGAFDDAYVDLGGLKGNIGDQNYEIPADVDLSQYQSVVIWCDRFNVAFGAADLLS